jgi:Tetracyclin repressor-like, C-terminal domain
MPPRSTSNPLRAKVGSSSPYLWWDFSKTEPAPASDDDWADAIRKSAISMHEALDRHPWATSLLASSAGLGPARLKFVESLLVRLDDAGFFDHTTYHAYHVLDAYIVGFSLWQAGHLLTAAEQAAVVERLAQISFEDFHNSPTTMTSTSPRGCTSRCERL